uniref:Transmembrane protein n=1 Tax=Cucumis melo TaxID=3656 RepID=A0A9I9EEF5_CUCME
MKANKDNNRFLGEGWKERLAYSSLSKTKPMLIPKTFFLYIALRVGPLVYITPFPVDMSTGEARPGMPLPYPFPIPISSSMGILSLSFKFNIIF